MGLDPTSGLLAGEGHLPLAATPNPDSAAPITGCVEPCDVDFSFQMSVTRVADAPRVTKPYTEEQWAAVEQLGHKVDARLDALDVRLTMGGEPTFVSIDDMEGPEWNMTADSPQKRRLAGTLLAPPVALLWPRGAVALRARQMVSGRVASPLGLGLLLAEGRRADLAQAGTDRRRRPRPPRQRHHGPGLHQEPGRKARMSARITSCRATKTPGITSGKSGGLPVNVDPLKSNLENEEERKRLARIFERGLSQVVGYALPIRPIYSDGVTTRWESGRWLLRQENMFLLPGDSPMGLRLPLDSLPWYATDDSNPWQERDPLAPRGPLPSRGLGRGERRMATPSRRATGRCRRRLPPDNLCRHAAGPLDAPGDHAQASAGHRSADAGPARRRCIGVALRERAEPVAETLIAPPTSQTIRTALCVEAREGRMHVFMPPVARLEDYLNLVEAIEDTAEELAMPVMIEGYTPPWDHRLQHFKVTPDPGVIEVNLQPSENWQELVDNTTTLYDEARRSRLGTEKFMLDGRHTGTGGGNHIVLGGAKPIDSPFLRRPDLLRSLVAYWNNRPSLSYLFSGLFVGPTSQAPRVDEARHESLYELETAFTQLPGEAADMRRPGLSIASSAICWLT